MRGISRGKMLMEIATQFGQSTALYERDNGLWSRTFVLKGASGLDVHRASLDGNLIAGIETAFLGGPGSFVFFRVPGDREE